MKDPYAVLLQKENEIQRVRSEIEALRSILPLLADEPATAVDAASPASHSTNRWPLEVTKAH